MTCQVFVRRREESVSNLQIIEICEALQGVVREAVGVPAEITVFDVGRFDHTFQDVQVLVFVSSGVRENRNPDLVATLIADALVRTAAVHNRIAVQVIEVVGATVEIPASCPT